MLIKNKSVKLNIDTLISARDEVTKVDSHIVQLSSSADLETGSVHSFINVINKEAYLENIEEINESIEELKGEFAEKVLLFGMEAEALLL